MAAQYQAPTAAVGQFVQAQQTQSQAAQAVQQAVAALPPPDVDFQQQMQQHQQQMQQQMQAHQQQMQQQMQAHQQQMRVDFRAVSNSVARLHNSRVARNQALQWLHNEQGHLPAHAPVSRRCINLVVLQQVNALLQHYGLEERAAEANMDDVDRRFLLLEHLGAESPEAAAAADQ